MSEFPFRVFRPVLAYATREGGVARRERQDVEMERRKGRSPSRDSEDSRDRRNEKRERKEKSSRRARSRSRSRSAPRDRQDGGAGPAPAAAPGAAKRKRRAMWDVGADGQKAPAAPPMNPVASTTSSLLVLQEQALLTRKVRCLHVGNVTGSVTADVMRAFINAAMHKENFAAAPGEVIIRIDPLPEKCACFLEFRSPITLALALALPLTPTPTLALTLRCACFLEFRSPIECTNALGLSGIELTLTLTLTLTLP